MAEAKPANVFVVDDDRGLVRLIERALRREGHETAGAGSAEEALAYLAANQPDLMLLDLKLDRVEARQLIEQLQNMGRLVPFVIITGQGDERVAVEMMKRGAMDYIVKDVHFQDVVPTLVARALQQISRDRKLSAAEHERTRLEREIIDISERERRRIGQDLHDGLGQHLTGIELMIESLEQKLTAKSKPEASRASDIARHVREAIRQTRALARGLSPVEFDANGLMSALRELVDNSASMYRIQCRFQCPTPVLIQNNFAATHLFRIAQEAVNNAMKHGRARNVEVALLEQDGVIELRVANDGEPFAAARPESHGMGLRIMNYRAAVIGGTLTIGPGQHGGTIARCTVPRRALEKDHEENKKRLGN